MFQRHSTILRSLAILAGLTLMVVALLTPRVAAAHAGARTGTNGGVPNFQHVFVIMMENTSYSSLIGNRNAPWVNFAAANYGLATNYHGVTHPSQPNYIAATSGSTNGVINDNDITINVPNIVDQIEASGRTWKAYMQSYSLCVTPLDSGCGNQLYERKHNPFVSYTDVQTNPARMANIVDFSQFAKDLRNDKVPNFVWISPDQCHDMHGRGGPSTDPCNFGNEQGLIKAGDSFLRSTVNQIMQSDFWGDNSIIFITWDESDFPFGDVSGCCDAVPGGGRVVTLAITEAGNEPAVSNVPYNHYSMLSTIETGWGLGCLAFTCDSANVVPMRDLAGSQN